MSTLSQLTTDLRVRLRDQGSRMLTDAQAWMFLADALREWGARVEDCIRENALVVNANEHYVSAPSDILQLKSAWWAPTRTPIECIGANEFAQRVDYSLSRRGTPEFAVLETIGTNNAYHIRLWPTPTRTPISTSLVIDPGSSGTTLTVTSTTSFRPAVGWLSVGSEKIIYQNKASSTTFTQCLRGVAGTVAVAYATPPYPITECDLYIKYSRLPASPALGTDIPEIDPAYHQSLIYGAMAYALKADGRNAESQVEQLKFDQAMQEAKVKMRRRLNSTPSNIFPRYY